MYNGMKKVFVVMLMAVAFAMPSKAQFKFGITGGLNMTNVNTKDLPASVKSRTGFFVGPTVKFSFPMLPIAIDAAAVYDQREGKAGEGDHPLSPYGYEERTSGRRHSGAYLGQRVQAGTAAGTLYTGGKDPCFHRCAHDL